MPHAAARTCPELVCLQRIKKTTKFNLNDNEETEELTHGGTALSQLQQVDPTADMDSDPEEGEGDGEEAALRFGAGSPSASRETRTKAEIMHEVIMKSKMYKAEKAEAKSGQMELLNQLDAGFANLRGLVEYKVKTYFLVCPHSRPGVVRVPRAGTRTGPKQRPMSLPSLRASSLWRLEQLQQSA